MSSHALEPSIYQPLDNPSQEIRLLQVESLPEFPPELINPTTVVGYSGALLSPSHHTRASIKCKLSTFRLDQAPPYKALSYTWGAPGRIGTIQVDGQDIPVGQNLFTAIRRLCRESWVGYLWADALCINQGDDDEKSHQVPLMGQIYGQADTVLVWLGEELDSTERAFWFMRKSCLYGQELMDMIQRDSSDPPTSVHPHLKALLQVRLESLNDDSNKHAVDQLFQNPYWTRVWVLQEFGHASSSLLICGCHTIDMAHMNLFLLFWETVFRFPVVLAEGPDWNDGVFNPFQAISEVRAGTSTCQALRTKLREQSRWNDLTRNHPVKTSPAHSDIFTLFVKTRRYRATDVRDKIYALLNLVPSEHRIVEPNYHLSEADLYRNVVTSGAMHYNSLYCLAMGGAGTFEGSPCPNLPSWIPDFRRIGHLEFPYACPVFMAGFGDQSNFDASGSKSPFFSIGDKHLTARGFSSDRIGKTTQMLTGDTFTVLNSIALSIGTHEWKHHGQAGIYKELFKAIFPTQLLMEPHNPFVVGTDSSWASEKKLASGFMFSLGLVSMKHYFSDKFNNQHAGMASQGQSPTVREALQFIAAEGNPALSYAFSAAHEELIEELIPDVSMGDDAVTICDQLYRQAATAFGTRVTKEHSDTGEVFLIPFHEASDNGSAATFASIFLHQLQSLWGSRAFAITERGCMGFVRPGTRVGDEICILYGCPSPLVIRPDGGEYLLVGDCCFEGMMRGEMVEKQEEGKFMLQDFIFK